MSDMSGPSMQSGFGEYLTGYPLEGMDHFVLAKTWYAPEMERPGCVWTHSLLIPNDQIGRISFLQLLREFRRPEAEGVEEAATNTLQVEDVDEVMLLTGFESRLEAEYLIEAVFGQKRPVIVRVDAPAELEPIVLRLTEELWPAARRRFSFCTGALMSRSLGGALLDLELVPRAVPPSQFRKSAGDAHIVDMRASTTIESWAGRFLDGAGVAGRAQCRWLSAVLRDCVDRTNVPTLVPIFHEWIASDSSARSVLQLVRDSRGLDAPIIRQLVEMILDRASEEGGTIAERELLTELCGEIEPELAVPSEALEHRAQAVFERSREDGIELVRSLLSQDLTLVGEHVLRISLSLVEPTDFESIEHRDLQLLSAALAVNPKLALPSELWKHFGDLASEILSLLSSLELDDGQRRGIVEAAIASLPDVPADALLQLGGSAAIRGMLDAVASGRQGLTWPWRSAFGSQSDAVLEWLDGVSKPGRRELELGCMFLTPRATQSRLIRIWKEGTADPTSLTHAVSAFGLALAFWEANPESSLLVRCFQPTYDAVAEAQLENRQWEWISELAPPVSWYRDWDRCERLAAALGRLLVHGDAPLEAVFRTVHSRHAIKKVAACLRADKESKRYLKSLRKAVESTMIGLPDQRRALLEKW